MIDKNGDKIKDDFSKWLDEGLNLIKAMQAEEIKPMFEATVNSLYTIDSKAYLIARLHFLSDILSGIAIKADEELNKTDE